MPEPWRAETRSGRRAARAIFVFLATGLLYGWANRLAETHFRITPDLAILFPPTGIGVAAVFAFGWPAALAVGVATVLTPWTGNSPAWAFAVLNMLEAGLAAAAFRLLAARGTFRRRDLELRTPRSRLAFFLTGVAGNTVLCAFLGTLLTRGFGAPTGAPLWRDVLYWWVGDATAGLMLGWPLLELFVATDRGLRRLRARDHHAALVMSRQAPTQISVAGRNTVLAVFVCWLGLLLVVGLARVKVPLGGALFSVPIMIAAYLWGFRGGLIAGSLFGWVAIGQAIVATSLNPEAVVGTSLNVVDRVGLGLLTGGLFEANRRMIRQMKTRYAALQQDLAYVASVLTAAVESKDPYTEGHMQRVSLYSVRIARKLSLPEEEIETIRLATLLHDIGKIGVPDRILFKPEALYDEELRVMRSHVEIGARIASNCTILKDAVPVIRSHQERWDGRTEGKFSGYPDGLKGEEIHLYARIAAVADAYDTMTTNRPYRKALGRERALSILREERGGQFDPRIVDAFLEDLGERRHKRATNVFSIADLSGAGETPAEKAPSSTEAATLRKIG